MDLVVETFTTIIFDASNATLLRTSVLKKSKPWWNDEIRELQKEMARVSCKSVKNPYY